MSYSNRHFVSSGDSTIDGVASIVVFAPMNRILVQKIAARVTNTNAGGAQLDFKRRRGASTDTLIGTVNVPASNVNGKTYYKEIAAPVEMLPGDVLVVVITEGGTAATSILMAEYSHDEVRLADVDALAGTTAFVNVTT